ncbi:hypothetical protein ACQ86N_40235 [Puia sp. P3]|uniref:hypothetical protein n=1 Tax=Puia sp. P3 TaxID=3423952 RepID=UPI003D6695B0
MTSTSTQNPSLTYMAMTARAVDHAVSVLKKDNHESFYTDADLLRPGPDRTQRGVLPGMVQRQTQPVLVRFSERERRAWG